MDYQKAVETVLSRLNSSKKGSLDHVRETLVRLNNPHRKFAAIHVAGTNGKGSTAAIFAECLKQSGRKTGLFISPHLVNIRERIQINGADISEADFARAVESVLAAETVQLSFFELLTCAAFVHYAKAGAEICVIETGIGGRLDTTNILETTLLSVITSIGLDHTEMLGDTIEKIAFEKSGIMRRGKPCVCGKLPPQAEAVMKQRAAEIGAELHLLDDSDILREKEVLWEDGKTVLAGRNGAEYRLNLVGANQPVNAAVVIKGMELLSGQGITTGENAIRAGMENVRWNARFQIIKSGGHGNGGSNIMIIDGGHNPEAAASFLSTFNASPFKNDDVCFVLAIFRDKDYRDIISVLKPVLKCVVATEAPSPRTLPCETLADTLASFCPDAEIEVHKNIDAAFATGRRHKITVVIGSFYLAGAALARFS